jgi:hypothetical protein
VRALEIEVPAAGRGVGTPTRPAWDAAWVTEIVRLDATAVDRVPVTVTPTAVEPTLRPSAARASAGWVARVAVSAALSKLIVPSRLSETPSELAVNAAPDALARGAAIASRTEVIRLRAP